ncbi:MAG: hypothetical protein GX066_09125, partial [Clostridiaceae bacterium]|nr:hypothetical protein [Clostridiaceae bacterium]
MKKAISIILIISLSVICTGIFFPKGYAAGNSIPALEYAVFTDGKIQLKPDAVIKGDARTNSGELVDVDQWSCKIEGKLFVGPGYKPDFDNKNVTGGVYQLESDMFYPMPDFISVSADFINAESLNVGPWPRQEYTMGNAEQDSYFKSLTVSSSGKLTIDTGRKGNVKKIYVETLNISEGQVILAGEGKLLIFAQKIHTIAGSCIVNTSTQKERLHLFVEGEDTINISGDARFYGSIYAPNASVALGGSAEVHGNILAGGHKYDMVGNCHVINGAVYAPRAAASLSGTVTIKGAAVFKELSASGGGTQIVFAPVDFNIPGGFLTEPPLVPETITIEVKEDAFICSAK